MDLPRPQGRAGPDGPVPRRGAGVRGIKETRRKVKAQSLQNFWHDRLRQYDFVVRVISQPDEIAPFVDWCAGQSRAMRELLKGVV